MSILARDCRPIEEQGRASFAERKTLQRLQRDLPSPRQLLSRKFPPAHFEEPVEPFFDWMVAIPEGQMETEKPPDGQESRPFPRAVFPLTGQELPDRPPEVLSPSPGVPMAQPFPSWRRDRPGSCSIGRSLKGRIGGLLKNQVSQDSAGMSQDDRVFALDISG
jgi:hypothetical protein